MKNLVWTPFWKCVFNHLCCRSRSTLWQKRLSGRLPRHLDRTPVCYAQRTFPSPPIQHRAQFVPKLKYSTEQTRKSGAFAKFEINNVITALFVPFVPKMSVCSRHTKYSLCFWYEWMLDFTRELWTLRGASLCCHECLLPEASPPETTTLNSARNKKKGFACTLKLKTSYI